MKFYEQIFNYIIKSRKISAGLIIDDVSEFCSKMRDKIHEMCNGPSQDEIDTWNICMSEIGEIETNYLEGDLKRDDVIEVFKDTYAYHVINYEQIKKENPQLS